MGTAVAPIIRLAQPGDADGIARVETETWRDAYPTLLPDAFLIGGLGKRGHWPDRLRADGGRAVLVAEVNSSRIVAYATWGRARGPTARKTGQLFELYVDADHRDRGIGRGLCAEVARRVAARGMQALLVEMLAGNPNRFFYEALGARPSAHAHHDFAGQRLPTVIYVWNDLTALAANGSP